MGFVDRDVSTQLVLPFDVITKVPYAIINNFIVTEGHIGLKVINLGIPDTFIQHGSLKSLYSQVGLTAENIVEQILTLKGNKKESPTLAISL